MVYYCIRVHEYIYIYLHALNTHAVRVGEVRGVEPQAHTAVAVHVVAGDDRTSEIFVADSDRRAVGVRREAGQRRAV